MENNKLQVILKEQEIDENDVKKLVKAFGGPFDEVGEILSKYKEIEVTSEDDKEGMAKARELRLALKKARTTIENSRKDLKADIVKQGRAIDSVARLVKEEIEPAEAYLETQEKFAELKEAERKATLKAERTNKLMAFTDDISFYNLDEMNDEQFNTLLATLKTQKENEVAEAKKAEEARLAQEKKDAEEREAQRLENERLKKEAEQREAEQAKKDAEARAERERIEKESAEKLAKERAERQKLEDEKAEREAEEKKKEAEAEKARLAELNAGDKEKIHKFAQALSVIRAEKIPAVKNAKAQTITIMIDRKISELIKEIQDQLETL